jgi:hypothetical protein
MASKPDQATDAMWYLWLELQKLEPQSELGGIYANKSGYHNTRKGNQQNWPNDYSIEDDEDQGGPSNMAAALDWTFPDAQSGRYETIMKYSKRLLASGQDPNDTRLDGWREFYGQTDTDTHVEGWDFRYVVPATSDPSHLWHIHFSEDRDKVESFENKDKLLSVLRGDDVALTDADVKKIWAYVTDSPALGMPLTSMENWIKAGKTAELKLSNIAAPTGIGEGYTVTDMLNTVLVAIADLNAKVDLITQADQDTVNAATATALREGADAIDPE